MYWFILWNIIGLSIYKAFMIFDEKEGKYKVVGLANKRKEIAKLKEETMLLRDRKTRYDLDDED